MDKEKFLASGLIEQYVLGLTSPEESREVERYADAFPEIQTEIDALRNAIEQYATQYSTPPPDRLKQRVMQQIGTPSSPVVHSRFSWQLFSLWACIVLGATALTIHLLNVKSAYRQLQKDFIAFQEDCNQRERKQAQADRVIAFLKDAKTTAIHLYGTSILPDAHVVAYRNETLKEVHLNLVQLPPPPDGKQYQVWADVEGEMINMGLLQHAPEQLHALQFIADAESINITIEPLGGSEHPTVALLVANGKI